MLKLPKDKILLFDGAMGTALVQQNLALTSLPPFLNITNPQAIYDLHLAYLNNGANFITANTFSINSLKLKNYQYSCEQIITAAVKLAKKAVKDSKKKALVALDIGPLGALLAPSGTLSFEKAYELFKEQVIVGVNAGCDLILIETISDIYEAKAAILAAKEHSDLPIICTMTFSNSRTFSGTDIETMVTVLEGLGVDILGFNCSTGPQQMLSLVKEARQYSSIPILVQPNAGLPCINNGKTEYSLAAKQFAQYAKQLVLAGASLIGGCCGTTPEYLKECHKALVDITALPITKKNETKVASYAKTITIGNAVTVIGERINPTGKKYLKQALRSGDISYVIKESISQQEEGANILDINLGLPEINQVEYMKKVITEIQAIQSIPLQIDSTSAKVIEQAVRIYNGKPLINSVSGKQSSMDKIFPIAKKYGACVLGLTLDDSGIPSTAEERFFIAKKIIDTAHSYGIAKKNILIDCLTLTASAQQAEVLETLKAVTMVKKRLGVKTVLGVSNVSFGLPHRDLLNKTFLAMALQAGLDAPILNTGSREMMNIISAFNVLNNQDKQAKTYINKLASVKVNTINKSNNYSLAELIKRGLKDEIVNKTTVALKSKPAMTIINEVLIPALDEVGILYEKAEIFLPQLIQSAEVAKQAFTELRKHLPKSDNTTKQHKIVLATVQGDIHDIGKNIVKVILENYGYKIVDLGKDVAPDTILNTVINEKIELVGLSALMTTTVKSMKQTIELLKEKAPYCKVMVGGAVLNSEYASMIKADFYAKDAREGVEIARKVFTINN
ncbi:homocysteine S-methyltransferase family protein [Clostridium sp. 'deep sea']|uniref:homocysteine S-methyltransferase family protein n=1 Tax=Clostridium sp. 'deep sea' TaxID=2779445 RepID=UPI0018968431|nr:homocysteine S-methyltransferase family protein [Clostridium sp. 'deep sea']QOR33652.1 homocysteine S-methyltransferase family protein [Clostridium sp. 'deep sea']